MSDELMKLPEGWVTVNLETTVKDGRIGLVRSAKEQSTDQGFPYVRMQHYDLEGNWNSKDLTKVSASPTEAKIYELQEGDILFNTRNSYELVGKVAIWQFQKFGYLYNNNLLRLRFYKGILPKWIGYQMMAPQFRSNLESFKSATTSVCAIYTKDLNSQTILLPPLNEQKRIVAAIESLRERSQKARSALSIIPELCDKFRQSVLAAAFRGDLTADWREQNSDIEPASVLLERIREKRLVEAKNDKQKKSLEEIYSHEEEHGNEPIPNDWKYTTLEKLCYSFQYGTSAKSLPEGKIPVLRMGNLQDGEIDWKDLVYTDDKDEISKYILKPGDILFNRTNSPELVGKTSIYRGGQPAIFAGYLIKINNPPELDSEYLNYCLNTSYAKDYCWKVKTDGVSQSNINAQKLAKFEVPLCSLQEQHEIARQISSLFEAVSQIEQQYQGVESYLNKLDRSILAKAFRGELVEQDPNDEPASVLLDRIRVDREQQAQEKTKKPGTKRKRTVKADSVQ